METFEKLSPTLAGEKRLNCSRWLVVLCLLCCLASCTGKKVAVVQNKQLIVNDLKNSFVITNPTNHSIEFQLDINHFFPLSDTSLLQIIRQQAQQDTIPLEQAAWRFVANTSFHEIPYTGETWQHAPTLFLNSVGGGFCDDQASVLAKLWQKLGFQARVYGLEGHVVPEVHVNNRWEMFDPDHRIYYFDSTRQILSVKQLATLDSSQILDTLPNISCNPAFLATTPISRHYLRDFFETKADNKDQTAWHLNYPKISNQFSLPANSSLVFTFNEKQKRMEAFVQLEKGAEGTLQIPLVPFSANGDCQFSLENKNFHAQQNFRFPHQQFFHQLKIQNTNQKTFIYYLVNPLLPFVKSKNELKVIGSKKLQLSAAYVRPKSQLFFGEVGYYFHTKSIEYRDFLLKLAKLKPKKIDSAFILKHYREFLNLDRSLTEKDKLYEELRLKRAMMMLTMNPKYSVEKAEEVYPISLFYLYNATKDGKIEMLMRFLK